MHSVDELEVASQSLWMQGASSWGSKAHSIEDTADIVALPKISSVDADGSLRAIVNDSVHSVDVALQNPNFHDHEMFSWLHFPVDDIIEKGFYADPFGESPRSTVQIVKHSLDQLGLQEEPMSLPFNATEALLNDLLPQNQGFSGISFRSSVAQGVGVVASSSSCPNESKNMEAGAAAASIGQIGTSTSTSLSHHIGVEVTDKIQTPACVDSSSQGFAPVSNLKNLDMAPLSPFNPWRPLSSSSSSLLHETLSLPLLKPLNVSLVTTQTIPHRNFSHFSYPVAETRASLHALGTSSGPSNIERARQHHGQAVGSENKQISETELTAMDDIRQESLPPSNIFPASGCGQTGEVSEGKNVSDFNQVSPQFCNSVITASNRAMEKLHVAEQLATSFSRGSVSSSDEKSGKYAATVLRRRGGGVDDSECQSEDLEEATNSSKRSTKRSRAAEMHNLCERKRRDRINEKLIALRDLMPNSSKTAKASILDEAIKYVKLLQSQLQAWSARTGICIPSALIPSIGLQPLQMPVPHMGLGMGMGMGVGLGMGPGMGMGMGLVDTNAAAAVAACRTMLCLPSYNVQASSSPLHAVGPLQPCVPVMAMVEGQDCMYNTQLLHPYNMHVSPVHAQMQPSPMNTNMYRNIELYNAYFQGQQQQHLQWQPMHQQQLQENHCSKQNR